MPGLHHCLHHSDNLHIYLVIFPPFRLLLQSIYPGFGHTAETCKEEQAGRQALILEMNEKEKHRGLETADISVYLWETAQKRELWLMNGK